MAEIQSKETDKGHIIKAPNLIIGAGGALMQFCRYVDCERGALRRVLSNSICVDSGNPKGLAQAVYPANSDAETLRFQVHSESSLKAVEESVANRKLIKMPDKQYPLLADVQALIDAFREELFRLAEEWGNPHFRQTIRVDEVHYKRESNSYIHSTGLNLETDKPARILSRKVLFTAGGEEILLEDLKRYKDKVIMSSYAGSEEGMAQMLALFQTNPSANIVFVGAGASTYGCISWLLKLADEMGINIGDNQIKILSVPGLPIGTLNPMARDLERKSFNEKESRVQEVKMISVRNRHTQTHFADADLIVQATGYSAPQAPKLYDSKGNLVFRDSDGCYVTDRFNRMELWQGNKLEDLRGLGLACQKGGSKASSKFLQNYFLHPELADWITS